MSEPELELLQSRLHGTTPARMLRELAEALEVLTAERALVLLLADLQWSDRSTVLAEAYGQAGPPEAGLTILATVTIGSILVQSLENCRHLTLETRDYIFTRQHIVYT